MKFITYFILAGFGLLACNPIPATNPWDPNAPSSVQQTANVTGQVTLIGGVLEVIATSIQVDLYQPNNAEILRAESSVDVDGGFSLNQIIPGDYLLRISAPGYSVYNTSLSISPGDELNVGEITLTALPEASINNGVSGVVQLGSQVDHSGVLIQVLGQPYSVVSDESGAFTIPLAAGTHTLSFSYVGYQSQQQEVVVNESEFTTLNDPILLLGQPGQISGTLMLPAGYDLSLLSESEISLYRVSDMGVDDEEFARTSASTQDGSFLLSNIEVGTYQLKVQVSGFAVLDIPNITVEAAAQVFVGLLGLNEAGAELGVIRGVAKLSHPVGNAHAGILIEVLDTPYRTQTASDGSYTMTLPVNRYDLQFSYNGFGSEQLSSIQATALSEVNEIVPEVVLSGIEVRVALSVKGVHTAINLQENLDDATVLLNLESGGVLTASWDETAQQYQISQVSAGTHTLLISHPRFSTVEKTIVLNWGTDYILEEAIELPDEVPPQIINAFMVDDDGNPVVLSNHSTVNISVEIEPDVNPLNVRINLNNQMNTSWEFQFEANERSKVFPLDLPANLIEDRVLNAQFNINVVDGSDNTDEERVSFIVDQEAPLPLLFEVSEQESEQENYITSEQVRINIQPNFNGEWRVSIHEDPRANIEGYNQPLLYPVAWRNFSPESLNQLITDAQQNTTAWMSTSNLFTSIDLPVLANATGQGVIILVHARDEAGNVSYNYQAMWLDQNAPIATATLIDPITQVVVDGEQSISTNRPRVQIQISSNEASECVINRFQNTRCTYVVEVDTSSDFLNATYYSNFESSIFEIEYLLPNRDDNFEIYIRITDAAGNATIIPWNDDESSAHVNIDQTPPMVPSLSVLNHASHKTRFLITRNDPNHSEEDDLSHFEVERLANREGEVNGWQSFPLYPIVADDKDQVLVSDSCQPKDCRTEWSCLWLNPNIERDDYSEFEARGITMFEDRHQQSYDFYSYRVRAIDQLGNESAWSAPLRLEEALAPPLVQSITHYEEGTLYKTFYWNRQKSLSSRDDTYVLFNPLYGNTNVEDIQASQVESYTIQPNVEAYRPVALAEENLATQNWFTDEDAMYTLNFEDLIPSLSTGWVTSVGGFSSHHMSLYQKDSPLSLFDMIISPTQDRYLAFFDRYVNEENQATQYKLYLQSLKAPYYQNRWSTTLPLNYITSLSLVASPMWSENSTQSTAGIRPSFMITSGNASSNQIYVTALSGAYAGFSSRIQAPEPERFDLYIVSNQVPKIHGWIRDETLQMLWINQSNGTSSLMRASIDDINIIGRSNTIEAAEIIHAQNWRSIDENVLFVRLAPPLPQQSNQHQSAFYIKSTSNNGLQHEVDLMWLDLEDESAQPVTVLSSLSVKENMNSIFDVAVDQNRWHIVLNRSSGDEIEIDGQTIVANQNFISHLSWDGITPVTESIVYLPNQSTLISSTQITIVPFQRVVISFYTNTHRVVWADFNDENRSLNFIDTPIMTFGDTFIDTELSVNRAGTPQIHTITNEGALEEISLEALNLKQQAQNLEVIDIISNDFIDNNNLTNTQVARLLPIDLHATRSAHGIDHLLYLKPSSPTQYNLHYQMLHTIPTQTPQEPLNDEGSIVLDHDVVSSLDIVSNKNGETWASWLSFDGAIPGHLALKVKYIGNGQTPVSNHESDEVIIDQIIFSPIHYTVRGYGLMSRISLSVDAEGTAHLAWLSEGDDNAYNHSLSYLNIQLGQWNLRSQIEFNPTVYEIPEADRLNFDDVILQLFAGQPVIALKSLSTLQVWSHFNSITHSEPVITSILREEYDRITWVDHALFLVQSGFGIKAKKITFLCDDFEERIVYEQREAMAGESDTEGCYPNINLTNTTVYHVINRPYNRLNNQTDLIYQIIQLPNRSFGFFYTEHNENNTIDLKYKPLFNQVTRSESISPVYSPILTVDDEAIANQTMSRFDVTLDESGHYILYMVRGRDFVDSDLGVGVYRQHLALGGDDETVSHTRIGTLYGTPGVSEFNWDGDHYDNRNDPCPTVYGSPIEVLDRD